MKRTSWLAMIVAVVAVPSLIWAAKPTDSTAQVAPPEAVGLFDAMKAGDIEVKLIPKDSTTGTVLVTNKTKKPLTIKLPEAFAGVPVAAQFGGMGGMGGGMGGMGGGMGGMGGGMNQSMGGGMMGGMGGGMGGMGGGGMGGMGGGGGFFNVAPEKVGKLAFVSVCLEHGKKDPNPHVPYELRPLESVTKDAKVIETVKMLARGEIDQHSAQAAAWHLANGLTWQQLATKIGVKHIGGATEAYFTRAQLVKAFRASEEATRRAEKTHVASPGHTSLLNAQ